MKISNYTRRINKIYYFRLAFPSHLPTALNSKEILKSLRTGDENKACVLVPALLNYFNGVFAEMTDDLKKQKQIEVSKKRAEKQIKPRS